MKSADRDLMLDVMAGSAAVLAFVLYIEVGRIYHGIHGMGFEDAMPLGYLLFSWLTLSCMRLAGFGFVSRISHLWLWSSLAVGLYTRYWALSIYLWGKPLTLAGICLLLMFGAWASFGASPVLWARLRRVVAFVPGLIVLTPMVAGYWLDGPVLWLGRDASKQAVPTATVILLLDELNANASQGLQQVLLDRGFNVNFKPVMPIHASTVQVVPALFTGQNFKGARACGFNRVCATSAALDFSQVKVDRNDVDVVGFHHPYCAIQGLRSCQREVINLSIWQDYRWECAFLRRFGYKFGRDEKSCNSLVNGPWYAMREDVMRGVFNAPTLKQGGVLFAHLPLPHPPASGTGSLAEQYVKNVQKAEQLLGQILDRLTVNKVEPRILIFSDHPLRQSMWCSNSSGMFDAPCEVVDELSDNKVPLILAARNSVPTIANVQSNKEVFDVLREWLKH